MLSELHVNVYIGVLPALLHQFQHLSFFITIGQRFSNFKHLCVTFAADVDFRAGREVGVFQSHLIGFFPVPRGLHRCNLFIDESVVERICELIISGGEACLFIDCGCKLSGDIAVTVAVAYDPVDCHAEEKLQSLHVLVFHDVAYMAAVIIAAEYGQGDRGEGKIRGEDHRVEGVLHRVFRCEMQSDNQKYFVSSRYRKARMKTCAVETSHDDL